MDLVKHIFKKHLHNAIAILALIFIITAIPDSDIRMIPDVDSSMAKRVMNIGKISFEGASVGTLAVKGHYEPTEKSIFNIIINDEIDGVKSFKWNKNNGPYQVDLLTDKERDLSDGITIKFDSNFDYQPGDNWTINSGIPAKFNLASTTAINTGRQIAALYSDFSAGTNRLAANISRAFSPPSNLALKKAISGGTLAMQADSNRGDTALFDIEIAPVGTQKENKVLPAVSLTVIILLILILTIFVIRQIKKRSASNKNKME